VVKLAGLPAREAPKDLAGTRSPTPMRTFRAWRPATLGWSVEELDRPLLLLERHVQP
jgi:hypothetical protein